MRLSKILELAGYYGLLLSKITEVVLGDATPNPAESNPKLVIVLENHYDLPSRQTYLALGKHLYEKHGFAQWTTEKRKSKSQAQLLADQKHAVQQMTKMVDSLVKSACAKDIFGQAITAEQLAVADEAQIAETFYCVKPGASLEELELYKNVINSLATSKLYLTQLKEIGTFMKVRGMESDGLMSGAPEIVAQRNKIMVENIVATYVQGVSQFVTVGKDHIVGLILGLHKAGLLDQTLFLDLYSRLATVSNVPMTAFTQVAGPQQTSVFGPQRAIPQLSGIWAKYLNEELRQEAKALEAFSKREQLPVNIISLNVDDFAPGYMGILDAVDQRLAVNDKVCKPSPALITPRFSLREDVGGDITVTNKPMMFSKADQGTNRNTYAEGLYVTGAVVLFAGAALAYKNKKNFVVEQATKIATNDSKGPVHKNNRKKKKF